jgi:hypothetical protein
MYSCNIGDYLEFKNSSDEKYLSGLLHERNVRAIRDIYTDKDNASFEFFMVEQIINLAKNSSDDGSREYAFKLINYICERCYEDMPNNIYENICENKLYLENINEIRAAEIMMREIAMETELNNMDILSHQRNKLVSIIIKGSILQYMIKANINRFTTDIIREDKFKSTLNIITAMLRIILNSKSNPFISAFDDSKYSISRYNQIESYNKQPWCENMPDIELQPWPAEDSDSDDSYDDADFEEKEAKETKPIKPVKKSRLLESLSDHCVVCTNKYEDTDDIIVLNCAHVFHNDCYVKWSVYNRSCPLCRHGN